MEINLGKDMEERLVGSLQRYLSEQFEGEIGVLKAGLCLRFILEEIGPAIYHQAIADAQAYFQEKASDLENVCFVPEGNYWKKDGAKKATPTLRRPFRR